MEQFSYQLEWSRTNLPIFGFTVFCHPLKARIMLTPCQLLMKMADPNFPTIMVKLPTCFHEFSLSYLSQFNGTSCSLIQILPPLVSRNLFRCLIFNCYNISICKKEKLKDETSKKFVKTMEVNLHLFHKFSLDVSDCYNIIICKKGKVKDETSEKICETNGGQIKSKMSH